MKTLLILRHAKSSWKHANLADAERPLKGSGKRSAALIGTFLGKKRLNPQLAWCSPAVRARQTLEIVLDSSRLEVEVRFDARIYMASPRALLEVLSQTEEERDQILLIGHNPGLEELLLKLTGEAQGMPTAALAKVAFGIEKWSEIEEAEGNLEWLVKPKDLVAPLTRGQVTELP